MSDLLGQRSVTGIYYNPVSDLILYQTEDDKARIQYQHEDGATCKSWLQGPLEGKLEGAKPGAPAEAE